MHVFLIIRELIPKNHSASLVRLPFRTDYYPHKKVDLANQPLPPSFLSFLTDLTLSDSGLYTCQARSPSGQGYNHAEF